MFNSIIASLEIDVMQSNELIEAFDLAVKNNTQAMVVHPDLISNALQLRAVKQGRFKIIAPVDWPKGETKMMAKFQSMKLDALQADGYEILLTEYDNPNDIKKEITTLSQFVRTHLHKLAEVRIVIGSITRSPEFVEMVSELICKCPSPNMIRNDHLTKAQQNKANTKKHSATIDTIRQHTRCPLKISGNISTKIIAGCQSATRFGVNLKQAQSIISEIKKDPNKIQELMSVSIDD